MTGDEEADAGSPPVGARECVSLPTAYQPSVYDERAVRQAMEGDWLDDVIVLNESADEKRAGRVSMHRSIDDALETLEPAWVEDGEDFA